MQTFSTGMTVGQLMMEHPECTPILHAHQISATGALGLTLGQACAAKNVDAASLLSKLVASASEPGGVPTTDLRRMTDLELIEHVLTVHHTFLRRALPWLQHVSGRVVELHGERDARLMELDSALSELADWLRKHMQEEEEALFPMLLQGRLRTDILRRELRAVRHEHAEVTGFIRRLRECSDDYTAPHWADSVHKEFLAELEVLEQDILRHMFVENQVLLPRFVADLG